MLKTRLQLLMILTIAANIQAVENLDHGIDSIQNKQGFRIVFYNVENLFDTVNDPGVADEAFTPGGLRQWDYWKLRRKLINISRVLIHAGGWELPTIICMAEIENRDVLKYLLLSGPLRKGGYEIIHFDSDDRRGIDVAILYRPAIVCPIISRPVKIDFPSAPGKRSRDILYAQFRVRFGEEILHLFVNHWPSKYGGEQATEIFRMDAAKRLRLEAEMILDKDSLAAIVACGDFNDGPQGKSVSSLTIESDGPFIFAGCKAHPGLPGTHKHAGAWETLDQFLVSPGLVNPELRSIHCSCANTFSADYLFTEELNQTGRRPFRSFAGIYFQGGYSDHLPVFLDLFFKEKVGAPGKSNF